MVMRTISSLNLQQPPEHLCMGSRDPSYSHRGHVAPALEGHAGIDGVDGGGGRVTNGHLSRPWCSVYCDWIQESRVVLKSGLGMKL